jgi:hypothetical protein
LFPEADNYILYHPGNCKSTKRKIGFQQNKSNSEAPRERLSMGRQSEEDDLETDGENGA